MTEDGKLTDQQISDLSTKIEEDIVKKYKKRFIGTIAGLTIVAAAIVFFGWSALVNSVTDKIINKIVNDKFKQNVIKKVSESISSESNEIVDHMVRNQDESDNILSNIKAEHERVIDAATHEFGKTVDVLRKVREKYSEKSVK